MSLKGIAPVVAITLLASGNVDCTPARDTALDGLAVRMLQPLMEHSREFAGAIIQCEDGLYQTLPPVEGNNDSFSMRVKLLSGCHLVAIWHTHPWPSIEFSRQDVQQAAALRIPSYIGVQRDHTVRVLQPGAINAEGFIVWKGK